MSVLYPIVLAYVQERVIRVVREARVDADTRQWLDEAVVELRTRLDPEGRGDVQVFDGAYLGPRAAAAALHLVTGSTGAGKTSYARWIQRDLGALHLATDDWLRELFGPDAPSGAAWGWWTDRTARVEAQMREVAEQALRFGMAVVLDLGFTTRAHRAGVIEWTRRLGKRVRLWHVDTPSEERWRRVSARNLDTAERVVTREMFDGAEARFEPPTPDEAELVIVRT